MVRPGGRHTSQCGDALLAHTQSGFFAVADSPDRNPWASGDFLRQVQQWLSSMEGMAGGPGAVPSPDTMAGGLNGLVATVDYNANTTFTGIFLPPFSAEKTAWLFHNGDSLLFHVRTEQKTVVQLTRTNHCFVGRSQKIHQQEAFECFADTRLFAATDGIWDIFRGLGNGSGDGFPDCVLDLLCEKDVSEVPDSLLRLYDVHEHTGDDLGLVVIDPDFPFERYSINAVL